MAAVNLHPRWLGTTGETEQFERMTSRLRLLTHRLNVRWEAYKRYRVTKAELMTLSQRDLDDIGVSFWDIDRVARQSVGW